MTAARTLLLYSRPGCHLCEQAAEILERHGVAFRMVDIEGEADLERLYGLRIPVLRNPGSGQELDYPFNAEAARQLAGTNL